MSRALDKIREANDAARYLVVAVDLGAGRAYVRCKAPGSALPIVLDVGLSAMAAAQSAVEAAGAAAVDAAGSTPEAEALRTAHGARAAAAFASRLERIEDTIDDYLVACVIGVADGDDEAGQVIPPPDPTRDDGWDEMTIVSRAAKARPPTRWYARDLPPVMRRTLYQAILGWLQSPVEAARVAATFRRRSG